MAWWWWWPSSAAERLRRRAAAKRLQCQAKSALPLPPLASGLDATKESDIAVTAMVEELVARVKDGTLSSYEVVSVMAKRARECGGTQGVNAVTEELYDEALTEARQKDRERALTPRGSSAVLEGMPISIKDHINVKGTDSTGGAACRCFQPMPKDALVVELLRDAGAIVLCKTNVPQCLMLPETTNNIWGETSTPWDLTRTAGGSSGGEAALIAARGSLLGVGTDIGESWWGERKERGRERAVL
jgi:Asp-tRNA(Asn)/Glu-tRNA(Gln) amidotransferase A subunit family amidase